MVDRLTVRMTDDELKHVHAAALKDDRSTSIWAKRVLLAAAARMLAAPARDVSQYATSNSPSPTTSPRPPLGSARTDARRPGKPKSVNVGCIGDYCLCEAQGGGRCPDDWCDTA